MATNGIKKYILLGIGSIALALGMIGVVVPLLPTTPFLLLASFCYIRSSDRLHRWLMNHRLFGRLLYNYTTHRAVKRNVKITALVSLWLSLAISMYVAGSMHLIIFLVLVGIGVSIHLLKLKTLR
ncbi:inner membrane protein YbaN [Ruminiclostridium hungatei]|uniref:Inner membrane protein YbaN n=1 Tax=Ruminiclostridium hungatei TaxID=48256 RepID=A0A1V4SKW2_RUMHU|nr:YbaN family protein [Ruminiclostridium hungatei]OPX44454.1 inner membrane protein YbaN [Ruminiclostridium hungatei]